MPTFLTDSQSNSATSTSGDRLVVNPEHLSHLLTTVDAAVAEIIQHTTENQANKPVVSALREVVEVVETTPRTTSQEAAEALVAMAYEQSPAESSSDDQYDLAA